MYFFPGTLPRHGQQTRGHEVVGSKIGSSKLLFFSIFEVIIWALQGPILRTKNCSFLKFAVSVKTDNFEEYFSQENLLFLQINYQFFPKKIFSL